MELRQSKRFPGRLTLLIYRKGRLVASGMLRNISRQGLFISTRNPNLDLNQDVEIEFHLHDPDVRGYQRVDATLVRCSPNGLGVEFKEQGDNPGPELRSLLRWVRETNFLIPSGLRRHTALE